MSKIGIVCDSTCDLGLEWFEQHQVRMVPLKVLFGEDTYLDWIDLSPDQFYEKLAAAPSLPKTSQPSPADFAAAYSGLAEEGFEEIVSVHLTAALSGTFESATLAAADSPVPVRVIDTKLVSHATGLAVKAAVAARDAGGDADAIEAAALKVSRNGRLFFILDTLEYLVKGGRAGKAAGLAAAMLSIKPVLTFNAEGTIEPFKKVKGLRKAIAELAAHVAQDSASTGRMRLVVIHGCSPDLAEELRAALANAGADMEFEGFGEIGAVIGTYAGPGAVGCAYHPVE